MTNTEAISIIKTAIAEVEWECPMDYAAAFDKAVEALEKGIPKKVLAISHDGLTETLYCPSCSARLGAKGKHSVFLGIMEPYCTICGQKIDWRDYV